MASLAEPSSPSGVTGKRPGHQVVFFSYVVYKGPEVLFRCCCTWTGSSRACGPGWGYVFLTGGEQGTLRYLFQEHGGRQSLMTTDDR